MCCQLDYDGIRAVAVRNRAVVISEVRRYGIQEGDSADYPLGRVFLLYVEGGIVRCEIELATGETPHHRLRFWHRYRGALNLGTNRAKWRWDKTGAKKKKDKEPRLSAVKSCPSLASFFLLVNPVGSSSRKVFEASIYIG